MKFPCRISRLSDGRWTIRYLGTDAGPIEVRAASREEALEKMRNELRFWIESCPCTGQAMRNLEVELVEVA